MSDDHIADLLEAAAEHPEEDEYRQTLVDALLETQVVGLAYSDDEGETSRPLLVSDQKGQLWPVFSSIETAHLAWTEFGGEQLGAGFVKYETRDVFREAISNQIRTALNILQPFTKEFLVSEMSATLAGGGDHFERVSQGGDIQVREPTNVSDDLRRRVYDFVADKAKIKNASLAWVRYKDGYEGYLLVIVTDTPKDEILEGVDVLANMGDGNTVDVMVVPVDQEDTQMQQFVQPFFLGIDS